jgi:hypothetical protein
VTVDQVVRRAVFLARVHPSQSVSVAGPDGLEAMLALCAAGFDAVTCARQAIGAAQGGDALLIAGPMTRDDLAATLGRTLRLVRAGGVLVVQLAHPADDAVVRATLAAQGMTIAESRFDVAVDWLATHRIDR